MHDVNGIDLKHQLLAASIAQMSAVLKCKSVLRDELICLLIRGF